MSKEGESSQEFKMYNILVFNKNPRSLFWKIQCTDMWYICEFRHSFILVDKAPRLSISIDIWILSSDTSLFVSSTNSIQIVRRQCCLSCLRFLAQKRPNLSKNWQIWSFWAKYLPFWSYARPKNNGNEVPSSFSIM